ncbi:hypothetical protein [Pseudonocardia adelaidensis]|uniref:hypothetical protein n=1 Tax=Pseudonocardia adelaidensis TaxID=648754 RepID=UPI0031ED3576
MESNNVAIGIAGRGASNDVQYNEAFEVTAKAPDVVRSVSISDTSVFRLDPTDCIDAAIGPDSSCLIRIYWAAPSVGIFRKTVVVEVVADSGTASKTHEIVSTPPATRDPHEDSDTQISVDPPVNSSPDVSMPDASVSEDGGEANHSGGEMSGKNRPGSKDDQSNDTGPNVSPQREADSDESG